MIYRPEGVAGAVVLMDSPVGLVLLLSTLASLVVLVIGAVMCACCYRGNRGVDEDEEDSVDGPGNYDTGRGSGEGGPDERTDVKQLRKYPWKEPSDTAPFITRKTIKFQRPAEKTIVTENIQPNLFSSSSLNRSLGFSAKGSEGAKSGSVRSLDTESVHGVAQVSGSGPGFLDDLVLPVAPGDDYSSSGTGGMAMSSEKLGKINFSLQYDFQEITLTLRVIRAVDLPAKDFSGTSDPYVKIMLLPDKKHKLQTNIKRRNLNPRWNEVFAFEGFPYSKLQNRILYMQVLDYDRFSRDDPIGEIALPLSEVDLATGQTMWRVLQPCKGHTGKLGELLVSLCYQPTVGRITVVIMKCRDLKAKDINGLSDPYVKIWLMHEGKKTEKKKTSTKEKCLNPVFNESFIFNVPYERIRQTGLLISVMDYDRMGRNELIGQVFLGTKSGPMEVKHWNEMFSKTRQPVAQWHLLKDFG